MIKVTNDAGRVFNVKAVRRGEKYGLNKCLINERYACLIEFYDAKNEGNGRFDPEGQFVSRYDLNTIMSHTQKMGLWLDGGVDVWVVTAANIEMVQQWARDLCLTENGLPIAKRPYLHVEEALT